MFYKPITYIWEAYSLRVWILEWEWESGWFFYQLCDFMESLKLSELQSLHLQNRDQPVSTSWNCED